MGVALVTLEGYGNNPFFKPRILLLAESSLHAQGRYAWADSNRSVLHGQVVAASDDLLKNFG